MKKLFKNIIPFPVGIITAALIMASLAVVISLIAGVSFRSVTQFPLFIIVWAGFTLYCIVEFGIQSDKDY